MRIALVLLVAASSMSAAPLFQHGDVLVTTVAETRVGVRTTILIYGRDGTFKEQFAASDTAYYRETLVLGDIVLVPGQWQFHRFDAEGRELEPFSDRARIVRLSPARDRGVVASDGSGLVYRFNADGSIRAVRDTLIMNDPTARGLDMTSDQCNVVYVTATRLARWDSCRNTTPEPFGATGPGPAGRSLRMLRDNGFIASFLSDIVRYDSTGQIVRRYGIPGEAVALDIDGTSFWAGAGSTLVKVDIDSGAVLLAVNVGANIGYLSVAGEPRMGLLSFAEIPSLSPAMLAILAIALVIAATMRLST